MHSISILFVELDPRNIVLLHNIPIHLSSLRKRTLFLGTTFLTYILTWFLHTPILTYMVTISAKIYQNLSLKTFQHLRDKKKKKSFKSIRSTAKFLNRCTQHASRTHTHTAAPSCSVLIGSKFQSSQFIRELCSLLLCHVPCSDS